MPFEKEQRTLSCVEYIITEVAANNNSGLIMQYGDLYGKETIGWEQDPDGVGKNPNYLLLTEKTRKAAQIDWINDPARDVTVHVVSTWKNDQHSHYLTVNKTESLYRQIITGIQTLGHISPNNYAQLAVTDNVGHPIGEGKQAVFIFQTPNVWSWEHNIRHNPTGNPFSWRSSAIEVSSQELQRIAETRGINILQEYIQLKDSTTSYSYVPPSRILGLLEFPNRLEYDKFCDNVQELRNHYGAISDSLTEVNAIEKFISQSLETRGGFHAIINRLRDHMGHSLPKIQVQVLAEQKLLNRELIGLYGAMITRSMLEDVCRAVIQGINTGEMTDTWLNKMILMLNNFKPSYTATKFLRDTTVQLAKNKLRDLSLENQE